MSVDIFYCYALAGDSYLATHFRHAYSSKQRIPLEYLSAIRVHQPLALALAMMFTQHNVLCWSSHLQVAQTVLESPRLQGRV